MTNYFRRNRKSSVLSHILTPKETNLIPPLPLTQQIANKSPTTKQVRQTQSLPHSAFIWLSDYN